MRRPAALAVIAALAVGSLAGGAAAAVSVLFIGNSFTYGQGSPVHFYRAQTVTDLNGDGVGGVPALFKAFSDEAGLRYDVFVETQPGIGIDWHLANRLPLILSRPWNEVVLQSYSTLDRERPGNSDLLVSSVGRIVAELRRRSPAVKVALVATWSRADLTYGPQGPWYGKPIESMAHDVRAGYERAATATPGVRAVLPVGDAWLRAIRAGVATDNPYRPLPPGQLDLWTYDHYHASTAGYYLEALVEFGALTGTDPRTLGDGECAAYELGLSQPQAAALQRIAYEQLTADHLLAGVAPPPPDGQPVRRCPNGV